MTTMVKHHIVVKDQLQYLKNIRRPRVAGATWFQMGTEYRHGEAEEIVVDDILRPDDTLSIEVRLKGGGQALIIMDTSTANDVRIALGSLLGET